VARRGHGAGVSTSSTTPAATAAPHRRPGDVRDLARLTSDAVERAGRAVEDADAALARDVLRTSRVRRRASGLARDDLRRHACDGGTGRRAVPLLIARAMEIDEIARVNEVVDELARAVLDAVGPPPAPLPGCAGRIGHLGADRLRYVAGLGQPGDDLSLLRMGSALRDVTAPLRAHRSPVAALLVALADAVASVARHDARAAGIAA